MNFAHEGMNDNVCELMGKEMSGETRSVDASDVTAKEAAFAITKCDWTELLRIEVIVFVKGHEVVS